MDTQVAFHNPVIISSGIGGNFLGPVMIPFKLVTAELSCDLSLPGAARPVDDDENDLKRSFYTHLMFSRLEPADSELWAGKLPWQRQPHLLERGSVWGRGRRRIPSCSTELVCQLVDPR